MSNSVATNKKASFEYQLFDRFEAGLELKGPEVKSIRGRSVNINDSFVRIDRAEAYVFGMHISPYKQSGQFAPDPARARRLLLHKSEIIRLSSFISQKGYTVVPTRVYFKKGKIKLEIAIAKGKKLFDKREKIRKRETDRSIARSLKSHKNKR